jgi:hypothetical protein
MACGCMLSTYCKDAKKNGREFFKILNKTLQDWYFIVNLGFEPLCFLIFQKLNLYIVKVLFPCVISSKKSLSLKNS